GQGLLFAIKPSSDDTSIQWNDTLDIRFEKETNATTLLIQPSKSPEFDSRSIQLKLDSNGKSLETADWLVIVESKRDSQVRNWKKNFLDISGIVVSLITAVFAGVKQLEEEKKRQRGERIKQAKDTFDAEIKNDFSRTLQNHLKLTADWKEWDEGLQDNFRKQYLQFIENNLWDVLSIQSITDLKSGVDQCIQLCERMFEDENGKSISTLNQLQSAFQQDEAAPLALLRMFKDYPACIDIAKQIAVAFSPELKKKTINEYAHKFPGQIRDLRIELDFPDIESFPLQRQFAYFAKAHTPE